MSASITPIEILEFISENFCIVALLKLQCHFSASILMKNKLKNKNEHAATASRYVLCLKVPYKKVRVGWRESAEAIASDSDDDLLLNHFSNAGVNNLDW